MSQIITLTTDFGTVDGYVGAMKGRILAMNPAVQIVDITHDIEPQGIRQAAWCLKRATTTFPAGSVHVAVIDPGVGSERPAAAFKSAGHWFVGPDNGVFSEVIRNNDIEQGYRLHDETQWWRKHSSFDGLALFAPAAACMTLGINPVEMGDPREDFLMLDTPQPVLEKNVIAGEILMFDRFGNAITNIRQEDLDRLGRKATEVKSGGEIFPVVDHYQAGEGADGVAILNSDGLLEISVFSGSARSRFDLEVGDRVFVK